MLPILLTSAVSLLALVLDLTTVSSLISFGALVAFSMVNACVIKHFFIDKKNRGLKGALNNIALPVTGLLLTLWLWTNLTGLSFSLGLSWAAAGLAYLLFITRGFRRPTPRLELEGA